MKPDEYLRTTILELKDIDESTLTPDAPIDALELDSLDYVEILVGIKKHFGVNVEPELFQSGQVNTLGDLCRYITQRQSTNALPTPA